ncbi:MAG: hypothetical protein ABSB66_06810 [Candidatus Acidiferrales bacterium]
MFYSYLLTVLVTSVFLQIVRHIVSTPVYGPLYWRLDLVTLALGCGVIVDIPGHVFGGHVSLKRFTQWVAILTFGAIFLAFAIHVAFLPNWKPVANAAELERDLRIAQAIPLLSIVFLTGYYGIEIGKNMKGLILGFGVYAGVSIVLLTLGLFIGAQFSPVWKIVVPLSYIAALSIWTVALWSYEPASASPPEPTDIDYRKLAGRTQQALGSIQEQLDRTPDR